MKLKLDERGSSRQESSMVSEAKEILILAGPNGAGKTTFAREFLPQEAACFTFINADLIAAGLEPFRPERAAVRAGRIMLQLIDEHVTRGDNFAFETTLSARNYAHHIRTWRTRGYRVRLYFLMLPSPEVAIARVAERVRQGGHSIAGDVIRRRFVSGQANLEKVYKAIVDEWSLYDASGATPRLIDRGVNT
jgi:predicted ABC-type ATPase